MRAGGREQARLTRDKGLQKGRTRLGFLVRTGHWEGPRGVSECRPGSGVQAKTQDVVTLARLVSDLHQAQLGPWNF